MKYVFGSSSLELVCPDCKLTLTDDLMCTSCQVTYTRKNGVPFLADAAFVETSVKDERADLENILKNFFKRWPDFYEWCINLIAPVLFSGLSAKAFLKRLPASGLFLNLGSGPTRLHPNALNTDLFPFVNVDIVSLADKLPFQNEQFDAICSEQVLEHVPHPSHVVAEMKRVLKPGGYIYTAVPFVFPYHPSPKDYSRFSLDGLRMLFEGYEETEAGILCGPVSGMLITMAAGFATIFSFGIVPLQKVLNYFFMLILSPFKLLDYIYAKLPGAEISAAGIYLIVRKP